MFEKKSLYLGKSGCIRKTLLYSGISGCIQTKIVVFRQSGCNREKVVLFVQMWWFYSAKVVVLGQKGLFLG